VEVKVRPLIAFIDKRRFMHYAPLSLTHNDFTSSIMYYGEGIEAPLSAKSSSIRRGDIVRNQLIMPTGVRNKISSLSVNAQVETALKLWDIDIYKYWRLVDARSLKI